MPRNDTTVTLTLKLVYNGREDLTVTKVYTILFKGTDSPRPVDYQALLETTLRETGLTNPRNGRGHQHRQRHLGYPVPHHH